jgi:predicted outer membrane protein
MRSSKTVVVADSSRCVVVLALLAVVVAGCNGGTVDKHALKRDAEKVGSLAIEGELLANDVSKGASAKYFARVHAKELSQAAADLADALGKRPTSPGITPDVRRLSRLAGKVSTQLEQLHLHPTDRRVAQSLEQPLADDAEAANKLAK